MSKTQITQLLSIAATVIILGALPAIADTVSTYLPPDGMQTAPQPAHSLGTLNVHDLDGGTVVDPNAPAMQAMVPVQNGKIAYVTGGIGDAERDQLDAIKANYKLRVLNASKSGEFLTDTQIVMRDNRGTEILNVTADPILLVDAPAGNYTLKAMHDGQSRSANVRINGGKMSSLNLIWP